MNKERRFLQDLRSLGLLEYGSVIESGLVHELLAINLPDRATRAQFEAASLAELACIDHVRDALLSEGKYLGGCPQGYRVFLPSENAGQVEAYMKSADRKLRRAQRLSRATPRDATAMGNTASHDARIALKQQPARSAPRGARGQPLQAAA